MDNTLKFVFWPCQEMLATDLGGKAISLLHLARHGSVPPWFALRASAVAVSGISSMLDPGNLAGMSLPAMVQKELDVALAQLCPHGERVAIRSSAMDEDGLRNSFAGQLESFLNIRPDNAGEKILAVWQSGRSERVVAYCRKLGLSLEGLAPAVIVQRMVNAEVSGVAFSADPVTGRRTVAIVSAVYGLGSQLVSGQSNADTWKIDRTGQIIARNISRKIEQQVAHVDGGLQTQPVPADKQSLPVLTDEQVRAVARLVRRVVDGFGPPQDIEWALADGKIHVLQARPITTLNNMIDPDSPLQIWDNSNITESYSGVTTPLTFTFARRAYEGVYRQFCHLLAVPAPKIKAHHRTFREMLGLLQGRIYYNLLNWYRVLALLPGFRVNRRFMEQMMGVKEPLPDDLLSDLDRTPASERARDAARLIWMCLVIVVRYLFLSKRTQRFEERLQKALLPPTVPLRDQRLEELAAYFLELERKLLTKWDAPLLNDFYAMVFSGVLRRLVQAWCDDRGGSLLPALLCAPSEIISAQPAQRILEMGRIIEMDREMVSLLRNGSVEAISSAVAGNTKLHAAIERYLDDFSDRCLDELKLESRTLREHPLPLFRAIGQAAAIGTIRSPLSHDDRRQSATAAEQKALHCLDGHPIRRALLRWVLQNARARVRDRENLRFERTRLFGRVRAIFVEAGKRLAADGHLNDPREVFYLEVDDILGFVAGTATTTDLRKLVSLRQAQFEAFRKEPTPPSRVTTRGSPYHGRQQMRHTPAGDVRDCLGSRQGIACCPGRVRGAVRVIRNPTEATIQPGEIIVAQHTDPGWVLLLTGAAGLLVERGSLLSHSSIVARELQIPTIVGLAGLTEWLQEGELIEMDGASGTVQRLESCQRAESQIDGTERNQQGSREVELESVVL